MKPWASKTAAETSRDVEKILSMYAQMKKQLHGPSDEIWKFECGICGDPVDEDHQRCLTCDEVSGEWVQYDERGERIEQ